MNVELIQLDHVYKVGINLVRPSKAGMELVDFKSPIFHRLAAKIGSGKPVEIPVIAYVNSDHRLVKMEPLDCNIRLEAARIAGLETINVVIKAIVNQRELVTRDQKDARGIFE